MLPRDFSVSVERGPFGGGDGSFVYGRNGVRTILDDETSCLRVLGNHAVVAGVADTVVVGDTTYAGLPFVWYAVDNGTPGSATRDAVTAVQLLEPADVAQMPDGFPKVCPAPDVPFGGVPYADVIGGDIVVRDVP